MPPQIFERVDVRETPKDTEAKIISAVSTATQNIDTGDVWVDVTGCIVTMQIIKETTVAIFGNAQANFPANIQDHGLGIRFLIDGGTSGRNVRTERKDYGANITANDKLNVPTQDVVNFSIGSHTIKLQVQGYEDGAGTKVNLLEGESVLTVIADQEFR